MIILSELFRVEQNMPVWAMELIADRHPGNMAAWIVKKEFEPQPHEAATHAKQGISSAVQDSPLAEDAQVLSEDTSLLRTL